MHHSPLRQVVTRPSGPVDLDAAAAFVAAHLPGLDDAAASALAVVDVAGHPRADAAERTGLEPDALAGALARARKALRRALHPLPGSGWCERAEGMISDDLDGELVAPGPARLAVHLANCSRCVEHERRLAQATDELVRSFLEAHPEPAAPAEPEPPPAPPLTAAPPWGMPEAGAAVPDEEIPVAEAPVAEPNAPVPSEAAHDRAAEPDAAQPVAAASPPAPLEKRTPPRPATPAAQPEPKRHQRYTPPPPTRPEDRSPLATTAAWNLLLLLAALLAIAAVAITVVGITGGNI